MILIKKPFASQFPVFISQIFFFTRKENMSRYPEKDMNRKICLAPKYRVYYVHCIKLFFSFSGNCSCQLSSTNVTITEFFLWTLPSKRTKKIWPRHWLNIMSILIKLTNTELRYYILPSLEVCTFSFCMIFIGQFSKTRPNEFGSMTARKDVILP